MNSDDAAAPQAYQRRRWHSLENTLMSAATRAGFVPHTYLLTTRGRKTGQPRSNPVTIVKHNNQRWLVAPYGAVPWVLNARAAGEVTLSRRGRRQRFAVREVSAAEAGAVLKRYVAIAGVTEKYFAVDKSAPATAFAAEADAHPVFELTAMPKRE
jgi:deazaflavin-dependent oxidoreductase (nitroreductase family)